jgi:hypothetical protein
MTAKTAALVIGIIFIAVGILGFIENPVIYNSESAIFHADTVHSSVHIVSGVLFLLFALAASSSAKGFLIFFGIVYLLIGVLGLASFGTTGMGKVLGFLHVNGNDNILHVGLGVVILLAGLVSKRTVAAVA